MGKQDEKYILNEVGFGVHGYGDLSKAKVEEDEDEEKKRKEKEGK